jgi:hypothetical protein
VGEDWRLTLEAEEPEAAPVLAVDFSVPESGPEVRGEVEAWEGVSIARSF